MGRTETKSKLKSGPVSKSVSKTVKTKTISEKETKAVVSEIDDLFATIKDKKLEKAKLIEKEEKKAAKLKKPKLDTSESTSYGIIKSSYETIITNPEAPLERIDKESGLPVYKAHLLKVGEGGGTELCPFDCNCCF